MNTELRKAEILNKINNMTHRQLVQFGRTLGIKLGDYMKIPKDELSAKIRNSMAEVFTETACDHWEGKLIEVFPQGLYVKGQHRKSGEYKLSATASGSHVQALEPFNPETVPASDDMAALASLLARLTGKPQAAGISETRVLELIRENQPETPTYRVEVKTANQPVIHTNDKPRHAAFKEVLGWVAAKRNVLLVGPAGCGKTHLGEQIAEALGIEFGFTGAVPSEYKLLGFRNAQGEIVRTVYRDRYEFGGLFLWDELDGSSPNAMLAFNAGLANGHQDFPDCMVKRHENFRAIASANTYGNGADRQYVGRNQLDAASLDRFVVVPMDYDEILERSLFGDHEWVAYVHKARRAVRSFNGGIRHVVSMRAIADGLAGFEAGQPRETVERAVLWKSLSPADITKIKGAM